MSSTHSVGTLSYVSKQSMALISHKCASVTRIAIKKTKRILAVNRKKLDSCRNWGVWDILVERDRGLCYTVNKFRGMC